MRRYTTTYVHRTCENEHYKHMVDRGWTCVSSDGNEKMVRFKWRETLPACLRRVSARCWRRKLDIMAMLSVGLAYVGIAAAIVLLVRTIVYLIMGVQP